MSETAAHRVQLLQGNPTVRRLMAEALEESGFAVSFDEGTFADGGDELADLLIVDVDSGLDDIEEVQGTYTAGDRPVLVCGLRASREVYAPENWIERPFAPDGFVAECKNLLGLKAPGLGDSGSNEKPEHQEAASDDAGLDEDSTPDTQRLTLEDAEELEEKLGLEKGALSLPPKDAPDKDAPDKDALDEETGDELGASIIDTDNLQLGDDADFLEIDTSSSIVLDVEDLEDVQDQLAAGGSFIGEVAREALDESELIWEEPSFESPQPLRSPTLSRTMPDAPAVMAPEGVLDEVSEEGPFPEPPVDDAPSSHGSVSQLPPQLERQIDSVAKLLANSWGRIGLAARPRDRADHVRKVLRAIFTDGLSAAAAEVERIPGGHGFSGDLASLDVESLLQTARRRKLRGRLELSVGEDDYVLYIDGDVLDDIENLSGDDDALLLDILLEQGRIAHEVYERLQSSLTDELGAPILMQLREAHRVDADDVARARRERAVRLLRRLCEAREGRFAFMNVDEGTGHAWPVDGISASVEALLDDVALDEALFEGAANLAESIDATFIPAGFQLDEHLPQTVEVPDPDEES